MLKYLKWLLIFLVFGIAALGLWVYTSTFQPDQVMQEVIFAPEDLPVLEKGQRLRVLSWNVQFMAGNKDNHFFYDDGTDPWPSKQRVMQTLERVATFIRQQNPDIVLLQEVDDLADRTHLFDQTQGLLAHLPDYQAFTETFYWKADYVPHPNIDGRVGMKLVVLSKYTMSQAYRHALPPISSDDMLRRQFNLKRAMLEVTFPVSGAQPLIVINTHLSAFAQGSDTMQRQIAAVMQQLAGYKPDQPWLMGGDFNLLPDQAGLNNLEGKSSAYNAKGTELAPLINAYPSVPSLADIAQNPQPWHTYMPSSDPQRIPDRTIDYVFYSANLTKIQGQVMRAEALALSDHLPILVEVALP